MDQSKAHIFLSAQREYSQDEQYRSIQLFSDDDSSAGPRNGFQNLKFLNDITLAQQFEQYFEHDRVMSILVMPIVGTVELKIKNKVERIEVGQVKWIEATEAISYSLRNPYHAELINVIHAGFTGAHSSNVLISFDLSTSRNSVVRIGCEDAGLPAQLYAGLFDGRREGAIPIHNPGKGAFIFSVEGAFEVQNRLLHPRDALAVWQTEQVEFEALSNEAILVAFVW